MTPLAEMIPTMSDADLVTLRANAARLVEHGASTLHSFPLINTS